MVCAVTGLDHTYPGQGFGIEAQGETPVLEPVLHFRLILPEGVEPAVMLPKLRQIEEEEPELHIVWNEKLQEIQIQIMGEVQTESFKKHDRRAFWRGGVIWSGQDCIQGNNRRYGGGRGTF